MPLSFRLTTIFYVIALLAASLATFGAWGILAAAFVLAVWILVRANRWSALGGVAILLSASVVAVLPFLFPRLGSEKASVRNDCLAQMRDLAVALQNYHDIHGSFPPPYLTDANGAPAHSWRVLILPFIEETPLYNAYNFNEPWNGPNNRKLADLIPIPYRCPGKPKDEDPGCTTVFAVVGDQAAWRSDRSRDLSEFTDGPSDTILVIENCAKSVNWMEPTDISYEEALRQLTTATYSGHRNNDYFYSDCNVCFADGHARWIWPFERPATATALLTLDAQDHIDEDSVFRELEIRVKRNGILRFIRIFAPALFIALALLPAFRIAGLNPRAPAPPRELSPS